MAESNDVYVDQIHRHTLATAFRRIAQAADIISAVLHENERLNNSVPTNWPLGMSADEFAAECHAMAEHYEQQEAEPPVPGGWQRNPEGV